MRSILYAAIAALIALAMPSPSQASCVCRCSNGFLQPLCSNPFDIPPICPATGCPTAPVSVLPPPVTVVPPPAAYPRVYYGTPQLYCRTVRVCDPYGICRLQELCG